MPVSAGPDLKALTPSALRDAIVAMGLPRYRADQLLDWLYKKGVDDLGVMTNVGAMVRQRIQTEFACTHLEPALRQESADGTIKVLWNLPDTRRVESVWLVSGQRRTICLSTQVGCAFACRFCASGDGPLVRNLTVGEIVDQVLGFQRMLTKRPTNLVYMGMGEPLVNYDAVRDSIAILSAPDAYGMSARRITVSTVGYLPGIRQAIGDRLPVKLAFSLHAPSDAARAELMPGAERFPLDDIMDALLEFRRKSKRSVTFEYVLLAGVNDSDADARGVAKLANRIGAKVNLILFNPVQGGEYAAAALDRVDRFQAILRAKTVPVFVRVSGGRDIDGACGQLRRSIITSV